MIGMNFSSFIALLILSFIAAIVMHSGLRYPTSKGVDAFFAKWIAGWFGAWLGSPVLGHWWFRAENIYVVPALVGAFVGVFALMYYWRKTQLAATGPKAVPVAIQPEMQRKAS